MDVEYKNMVLIAIEINKIQTNHFTVSLKRKLLKVYFREC